VVRHGEPALNAPMLRLRGLIKDVIVEPNTVAGLWPKIDISMTGISPDLILRLAVPSNGYIFIEK
jgi:hypothetical protein